MNECNEEPIPTPISSQVTDFNLRLSQPCERKLCNLTRFGDLSERNIMMWHVNCEWQWHYASLLDSRLASETPEDGE